jgi:hypothetical protein
MYSPDSTRINLNGALHKHLPDPLAHYARAYMYGDGVFG